MFDIDNRDDCAVPVNFVAKNTNVMVSDNGQMDLLLDRLLVQVDNLLHVLLVLD